MDFSPVWKLQLRHQVQQGSECNRVVMETQGYRSDGNTGFQVEFISSQDKPPPIQEMPSRALNQCAGFRNTGFGLCFSWNKRDDIVGSTVNISIEKRCGFCLIHVIWAKSKEVCLHSSL